MRQASLGSQVRNRTHQRISQHQTLGLPSSQIIQTPTFHQMKNLKITRTTLILARISRPKLEAATMGSLLVKKCRK